jgi:hypothetical protein
MTDTPITAADMHRIVHCSGGSCKQGRAKCETPLVCHSPLDDDAQQMQDLTWALLSATVFLGLTSAFAYWCWTNWPLLKLAFGLS